MKDGVVTVSEENFGLGDEGAVDPLLGSGAAGLVDDGTKVTLGEAHAVGVVADLVLLTAVLVNELDKAVEDGLFAGAGGSESVGLKMEQTVVVVHQGGNETGGCRTMVVRLVDEMPKGVEDVGGCLQIVTIYG